VPNGIFKRPQCGHIVAISSAIRGICNFYWRILGFAWFYIDFIGTFNDNQLILLPLLWKQYP